MNPGFSFQDDRMGLGLTGHHLYWCADHGALMRWPRWIKQLIVTVFNFVTCRLFGHQVLGPMYIEGEWIGPRERSCTCCLKTWPVSDCSCLDPVDPLYVPGTAWHPSGWTCTEFRKR